jgi:hypothetical protein
MRFVLAVGILLAALAIDARRNVHAAGWCAYYDEWTYNCGFTSFQQCLATISGVGGICRRDPHARPGSDERRDGERSRRDR